jgi:NADH-quinone oxidoreductase subunit C/D
MLNAEVAATNNTVDDLFARFGAPVFDRQATADHIPTLWLDRSDLLAVLNHLQPHFPMLLDLFGIDERLREHKPAAAADFTVVYHLFNFTDCEEIRLKVALRESDLSAPSAVNVWPNANWYEREAWDMYGIEFSGHPNLRRILLPPTWEGFALRKDHPARATEMEPFSLDEEKQAQEQEALLFRPEEWGMARATEDTEFMFLNLGPNHPSVHGVFRIVLQLDGEVIVDAVPDIGYHHRGAEKMAERQTWHSYIPYTDRIDYLGGVMNNMA